MSTEIQDPADRARQERRGKIYLTESTAIEAATLINTNYPSLIATPVSRPTWGRGWYVQVSKPCVNQTYRVWHLGSLKYYYRLLLAEGMLHA